MAKPKPSDDDANSTEHSPERTLWLNVIKLAIDDATTTSNHERVAPLRNEAIRWLLYDNRDFIYVCHLAGVEPMAIRDLVKRQLS